MRKMLTEWDRVDTQYSLAEDDEDEVDDEHDEAVDDDLHAAPAELRMLTPQENSNCSSPA